MRPSQQSPLDHQAQDDDQLGARLPASIDRVDAVNTFRRFPGELAYFPVVWSMVFGPIYAARWRF
ncbi:MAG: hypothetical protein QOF07_2738 [Bradyrhizobium sp.]|nr:hypothetical protein [Bradyrhizobium sp.]